MRKRVLRWLWELLFPPKCPACGVFLKKDILDETGEILCDKCLAEWRRAVFDRCGECLQEYKDCHCTPRILRRLDVWDSVKLISYERVRDSVGKKSILYMKKKNNRRLFAFFGAELARALLYRLSEEEKSADGLLVTYLPRSDKALREHGFDQSRELARAVADALSCECVAVFRRTRGAGKEQKHLGASARAENMRSAFALTPKGASRVEACRTLVMVDDVVTTGASLAGCIALLPLAERKKVLPLSVGITQKS